MGLGLILGALSSGANGVASTISKQQEVADMERLEKARSEMHEQSQMRLAEFKNKLDNAPIERAGKFTKESAAVDVPLTAAPVTELTSGDPGTGYVDPNGGAPDAIKGNYEELRARISQIQDPAQRAEALAVLEDQFKGEQKRAQDAVAGKTRTRDSEEVLIAARDAALKAGDTLAAENISKQLMGQRVHVGQGGSIIGADGKVIYQNHTAEDIAMAKLAAAAALKDKELAARADISDKQINAKQTMTQLKVDSAAKAKSIDPALVETTASLYGTYALKPPTDRFLSTPYGQAVAAKIAEKYPNYDSTRYGEIDKATKSFATGKQGDAVRSFNVALDHLNTLQGLGDALSNNDTQSFNRLGNFFATQTGTAAPTNFNAVKQIVGDEIVKAVVGSAGALGDREEIAKQISAASSPEQLSGVITQFKALMRGQLNGLRDQYQRTTGRDNFDDVFLSPEARAMSHGAPAGKAATVVNPVAQAAPKAGTSAAKSLTYDPATGTFH